MTMTTESELSRYACKEEAPMQVEPEQQRYNGFTVPCQHCKAMRTYVITGGRITLYSTGLVILKFWCQSCYELNVQELDPSFAEQMGAMGVPTSMVRVPMEVLEHPGDDVSPISEVDVRGIEAVNLAYFQERLQREIKGTSEFPRG